MHIKMVCWYFSAQIEIALCEIISLIFARSKSECIVGIKL